MLHFFRESSGTIAQNIKVTLCKMGEIPRSQFWKSGSHGLALMPRSCRDMTLSTVFVLFTIVLPLFSPFPFTRRSWLRETVLYSSVESRKASSTQNAPLPGDYNAPSAAQIFVCSNRSCRDKGSDSTMETFTFLTPEVCSPI